MRMRRVLTSILALSALILPGMSRAGAQAPPPAGAIPASPLPSSPEDATKPLPPSPIPDDPPPHEGAMIDRPHIIQPPDIIQVEVLEALPARPITGERLVRPDGTISLGCYGDLHVAGLTTGQVKIKILLHLKRYLTDQALGLAVPPAQADDPPAPGDAVPAPAPDARPPVPAAPGTPAPRTARDPFERDEPAPPPKPETKPRAVPPPDQEPKDSMPMPPAPPDFGGMRYFAIWPGDSDRVFVDITRYSSRVYYVLGDVGTPGRLPITGRETVLDALQFAGGFIPTAEPKDVHLYRPAQGGKPARDYKIDHEAILKGDPRANLQIFPGDRLVVGRNPISQKTVEVDRASALTSSTINGMLQYSMMARSMAAMNAPPTSNAIQVKIGDQTFSIGTASRDGKPISPADRDAMIKEWVEFLWSAASKEAGANLDEKAFREAILKRLAPAATPPPAGAR